MKTMMSSLGLLALLLGAVPAQAKCPARYKMDDKGAPSSEDRVGAVLYLAKHVPGIDVRKATAELDRLGLWYGMWFQTVWQGDSGRNRYRCWDGKEEQPKVNSPLWQAFNWTLTVLPYEIYRRNVEKKAPCAGGRLEVATCEAWMTYFRTASAYQRDLQAGRYDSFVGRFRKVAAERHNQAAMWKAHTTSLALARLSLPPDSLTEDEMGFLRGWASIVHYLDQTNFPTTRSFIDVFGKTMPRCFPLGGKSCRLLPDPTERVGLNPLQYAFAKAVIAYDRLTALPAVLRAAFEKAKGWAKGAVATVSSVLRSVGRATRKGISKLKGAVKAKIGRIRGRASKKRTVTRSLGFLRAGASRLARSLRTALRSSARRVARPHL